MIYIITAVHNRYNITYSFVTDLLAQTDQDFRLILVDDGSVDHTADMVKKRLPTSIILRGNGNLFWAGALQKAYLFLKKHIPRDEDIIFLANDDIHIPENFLETGKALVERYPTHLVSGLGYDKNNPVILRNAVIQRDPVTADGTVCEPGVSGNLTTSNALFMKAKVYFKIGGMHPVLIPHYCSDDEYTLRAARKGFYSISDKSLCYLCDHAEAPDKKTESLKHRFSKKSPNNPFYRMNYILMVTPPRLLPGYVAHKLAKHKNHN